MDEKTITGLAAEADAKVKAMSPEDKAKMWEEQKQSWLKGEAGIGNDRDEAEARQLVSERNLSEGRKIAFFNDGTFVKEADPNAPEKVVPAVTRRRVASSFETTMSDGSIRHGDWIQTFTGKAFFPFDPRPEDIDIEDIAHALSNQCRYGGHASRFYSVAEHCVILSTKVEPQYALAALMHDCAEAYLVDIPRPVKYSLVGYKELEFQVEKAIAAKFNLQYPWPEQVMAFDTRMIRDEGNELMSGGVNDWNKYGESLGARVFGATPIIAKQAFLRRFHELHEEGAV